MKSQSHSFTLALLFRLVTLVCVAFGWVALVRSTSPEIVYFLLISIGVLLGFVAGMRRRGTTPTRIMVGSLFCMKAFLVASYSAWVADYLQDVAVDLIGEGLLLAFVFPGFVGVLVFMLRAWTWSVHDRQTFMDD